MSAARAVAALSLLLVATDVAIAAPRHNDACAPLVRLIQSGAFDDPNEWGPALDRATSAACVAAMSSGKAEVAERLLAELYTKSSRWPPSSHRAIRDRICAFGARAALDDLYDLANSDLGCAVAQIESADPSVEKSLLDHLGVSDRMALAIALAPKAGALGRDHLAAILEDIDEARLLDPARDRVHHALCDDTPRSPRLERACAKEGFDRVPGWLAEDERRERDRRESANRAFAEERRTRRGYGGLVLGITSLLFVVALVFRDHLASRIVIVAEGGPLIAFFAAKMVMGAPHGGEALGGIMALLEAAIVFIVVVGVASTALWLATRAKGWTRVLVAAFVMAIAGALSLPSFIG